MEFLVFLQAFEVIDLLRDEGALHYVIGISQVFFVEEEKLLQKVLDKG